MAAPNIYKSILGGEAPIIGNCTVESACQLAISLDSGALPLKL